MRRKEKSLSILVHRFSSKFSETQSSQNTTSRVYILFFFLTPEGEKKILSDKHFYEYLRFQNAALDNNGNITGNSGNT